MNGRLLVSVALLFGSEAFSQELQELIPDAPENTEFVQESPPVFQITNAVEALSGDFRDPATSINKAGILIVRTDGDEPFNHNRKTCRLVADQASLQAVVSFQVSGAHFYDLITSTGGGALNGAQGTEEALEHATQFILQRLAGNKALLDSRYLEEEYPSHPEVLETYSFQIWASDPLDLFKLTEAAMAKLEMFQEVQILNNEVRPLPLVFIQRASQFAGLLKLQLVNNTGRAENVAFDILGYTRPAAKPVLTTYLEAIPPGTTTVAKRIGPSSSLVAYSRDSKGFRDQVFLGRGFGFFSDREAGGATVIQFDNRGCARARSMRPSLLTTECASIRGRVDQWAGIFLPAGSYQSEIVDLAEEGVTGFSFWARSDRPFRFQVEDVEVTDFDFHGMELSPSQVVRQYTVLVEDLAQRGFGTEKSFGGRILNLSWLIDPPDGQDLPFSLQVSNVTVIRKEAQDASRR